MTCVRLTAKKYVGRPGPPYHAQDCKGVKKKGNDGRMYISRAAANGVYRWTTAGAKAETRKVAKPHGKKYAILDNGSEPFIVFVRSGQLDVYKNIYNRETESYTLGKKLLTTRYKSVHIGDNDLKEPRAAPKGMYPGNSILVHISSNKYMYIGHEIYTFAPLEGDTLKSYYSPVGNSAVPYPYALGEKYAYFMLDRVAVAASVIDPKEDAYGQFYKGGDGLVKKKLKVSVVAKRTEG